jgi:hypothetical protein
MIQHILIKKKTSCKNISGYFFVCIFCFFTISFFVTNISFSQDSIKKKKDTTLTSSGKKSSDSLQKNTLQIDTNKIVNQIDTNKKEPQKVDSLLTAPLKEDKITNTKLFIYILLSVLGLSLFYFIFVQTLFKTFHKKRSSRQSMMLSWSLFLVVSILWIFIIWGIVANFWSSAAFMVVLIFLFIIGLIMTIVSVKSR